MEKQMKTVPHTYKIGDPVSYGFNGDWYPDGTVARITKKFLTTTNGHKYSLTTYKDRELIKNEEGRCIDAVDVIREGFRSVNGGTWALCHGHIREWNPEF
jgi:hypothetical protein